MSKIAKVLLTLAATMSLFAHADKEIPEFSNLDEIVKQLKLEQFKGKPFKKTIRIAVLDNGFNGHEQEIGKGLPANTKYHPGPPSSVDDSPETSYHGLLMAKLLYQLILKSGVKNPRVDLHLFNADGYDKFEDAVNTVAAGGFHLVVYSQVWQYGGNGDGKGFVNALVDKAIASGVMWINAVGNFGRLMKVAPVDGKVSGEDEWVHFADKKNSGDFVKMNCKAKTSEQCVLRAFLTWNDFPNKPYTGTLKDLDLFIYEFKDGKIGKLIASGVKRQVLPKDLIHEADDKLTPEKLAEKKSQSLLPMELVGTHIPAGTYVAKVKVHSKNFSASQDRLTLSISGSHMEMESPTTGETLLPPAEHEKAITIGAADFDGSSESKTLKRPEISLISLVKLTDGSLFFGTSTAAAMAGAHAAIVMGLEEANNREQLITSLKTIHMKPGKDMRPPQAPQGRGDGQRPRPQMPIESETCFTPMNLPVSYAKAKELMRKGPSMPIVLKGRPAIAIRFDLGKHYDLRLLDQDQFVFMTPQGLRFMGKEALHMGIPNDYYQVIPQKKPICSESK